jgi:hypothetical protein
VVVAAETLALYSDDCPGRESAGFLDVTWPLEPVPGVEAEMRRYVRDPDSVLPTTQLLAPYDRASALPREAKFTGYESDSFQLWVGADDDIYVYLVYGTRVEALPRAADEVVPCPLSARTSRGESPELGGRLITFQPHGQEDSRP